MSIKKDQDTSSGQKLLRMYHLLLSGSKPYYQSDLAKLLNCSSQTIIRLAQEVEQASPECFHSGKDKNRRWYRLQSNHKNTLGLNCQELQYISLCCEFSKPFIPPEIMAKIDQALLQVSILLVESDSRKVLLTSKSIAFFSKGKIEYSSKVHIIEVC